MGGVGMVDYRENMLEDMSKYDEPDDWETGEKCEMCGSAICYGDDFIELSNGKKIHLECAQDDMDEFCELINAEIKCVWKDD